MVLVLRTAPGSSYRNPFERVNCILDVCLYGIGVMRKHVFDKPKFERKLSQCNNVDEGRQVIKQIPIVNTELVKRSCVGTQETNT